MALSQVSLGSPCHGNCPSGLAKARVPLSLARVRTLDPSRKLPDVSRTINAQTFRSRAIRPLQKSRNHGGDADMRSDSRLACQG